MADAINTAIEINKVTLRDLNATIDDLVRYTGRTMHQAVIYAALKLSESGRSASFLGKRLRDIEPNPAFREQRASRGQQVKEGDEAPYFILRHRQGGLPPLRVPAWKKNDPRRRIGDVGTLPWTGNRGLAKRVWNVCVGKLGAMKGVEEATGTILRDQNTMIRKYAEKGSGGSAVVCHVQNRLTYLDKAYPGIAALVVEKGTKGLQNRVQAALDERLPRG